MLAVLPIEARPGAVAAILVDEVDALTTVQAGHGFALVQLRLAERTDVSRKAVTVGYLQEMPLNDGDALERVVVAQQARVAGLP